MSDATSHWILHRSGKWHLWRHGEPQSFCGRMTLTRFRSRPPLLIVDTNDEEAGPPMAMLDYETTPCLRCLTSIAGEPPSPVPGWDQEWMIKLNLRLQNLRVRVAGETKARLVRLLSELGPPTHPGAGRIFEALSELLLHPTTWTQRGQRIRTLPRLREALDQIPPSAVALHQLANTLGTWKVITGLTVNGERFTSKTVVETILVLPEDARPYIQHLAKRQATSLALMFHPNTVARAKREPALRGFFAPPQATWDPTGEVLDLVTDE